MSRNTKDRLLLIEKVLILKSLPIFKDTPENILADLAPIMQEEEFEQGTLVFREGDIGDCMYIIHRGAVRIHKKDTVLAVLGEKEVFGELSLLDAETRSASATCSADCTLFFLRADRFPSGNCPGLHQNPLQKAEGPERKKRSANALIWLERIPNPTRSGRSGIFPLAGSA
jgi:CRP/FNR family cyclic AMP-dependent transcriptional regulator